MNKYFAQETPEQILPLLFKKIKNHNDYNENRGLARFWKLATDYYFGRQVSDQNNDITSYGDEEEIKAVSSNQYRNLVKHQLALTCNSKSSFDYRAVNNDLKSKQQARLANNIVDYYLSEKRMFRHMKKAAEISLVARTGFTYQYWDNSLGKPYGIKEVTDEQSGETKIKIVYEGDGEMTALTPWHVFYNPKIKDWTKNKWVITVTYDNKYDLANRNPKNAEAILAFDGKTNHDVLRIIDFIDEEFAESEDCDNEIIPVFEFYHLPTDAVPEGRYVKFLSESISLYDGAYPYFDKESPHKKKLPVSRISAGEDFGSLDGYAESGDVLPLQKVLNTLYSTILTNQSAFGVQAVWMSDQCTVSEEVVGQGMVVLKGGPPGSQPVPLNLTNTPTEIFKFAEIIKADQQMIQGINSVVRGDPEHNLKSGTALGRMQAMAVQFASNFQQAWAEIQEDNGSFLIFMLQLYAQTERMISLSGKYNKGAMQSFTGKDISNVDRLICDLGNPLTRTFAGRIETADNFLEKGLIKTPEQYLELTETGNIDSLLKAPRSKLELITKENEMLLDGMVPQAMVGDHHLMHMQEHAAILHDPYLRTKAEEGDPLAVQLFQNVTMHIDQHSQLRMSQPPYWFEISGEAPPMMPPPPMPGPMNGGQPSPAPGPESQGPMPPIEQNGDVPPMPPPPPMPPQG